MGGADVRLIFHLSYPKGTNKSVNANTPKELCNVKYPDFSEAIKLCMEAGPSCEIVRSDWCSAFRQLCIAARCWRYLVMKARSPIDQIWYYFVDKCLPFRAAISCSHFQHFPNAIVHVVQFRTKKKLVNYLDDFLFIALLKLLCNSHVREFLQICQKINFPVSEEKTFWGTMVLTFLGMLIDTINQTVSIPHDKICKGQALIDEILDGNKKKLTVLQIQKICSFLNFLCRSIVPGRAFTRRMYALTAGKPNLKKHHHVRLNNETKLDLTMWRHFLNHPSAFCRPFMDFTQTFQANETDFYSDASGGIGMGAANNCSWMYAEWPEQFLAEMKPSIEFLELFALVAAILAWVHRYANRRIIIFCDNQGVVSMVNHHTSSCKYCMRLIRILVLKCLTENTRVFAKYCRAMK